MGLGIPRARGAAQRAFSSPSRGIGHASLSPDLEVLGTGCARRGRRLPPPRALGAAPARVARFFCPVVLHERLDVPARARRRSPYAAASTPYGHDYSSSGLERFYSLDGSVYSRPRRTKQAALQPLRLLPRRGARLRGRVDRAPGAVGRRPHARCTVDHRAFLWGRTVHFPCEGRSGRSLALGVVLACEPARRPRASWFGNADAPTLLLPACSRSHWRRVGATRVWLGPCLGDWSSDPDEAVRARGRPVSGCDAPPSSSRAKSHTTSRCVGPSEPSSSQDSSPFLIADPRALWDDTITYGAETYRIVGYGLSSHPRTRSGSSRSGRLLTRSRSSRPWSGCPSPRGSSGSSFARVRSGSVPWASRSRCSSCSTWDECSRTPTSSGFSPGSAWRTCLRRRGLPHLAGNARAASGESR